MIEPINEKHVMQVDAYPAGHKQRKDGSWLLSFETQELIDPIALAHIVTSRPNIMGKLAFAQRELTVEDVEPPKAERREGKSKSQRLYNVLFVWWKQRRPPEHPTFETFYDHHMERLIDRVKSDLEK